MNLKQRVINQLEQLAIKGPEHVEAVVQKSPERGYIVGIPTQGTGAEVGVSLSLADYDRYSVTLRHLEVCANSLVISKDDIETYLHECAAEITQRLIYLEEPLTLLELNTIDGIAQLRSSPPEHSAQGSTYWEVSVGVIPHPRAKLARYHWTNGTQQRVPLTCPATFATLGRLSEDLAASLVDASDIGA
jgi:hypothetical protein